MKHSISYYIREQLREDKSVSIPGLGRFVLAHQSATIAEDKSEILPPTLSLTFSEEFGNEQPLLTKISSVENFSIAKASKKLKKYTESLFNNLININKANIEGVGVLVRDSDNEITFNHTVESLTDEYQGLKPILLRPIKRMTLQNNDPKPTTENNVFEVNQQQVKESKSYRPWWIPIIGGVLLFGAYLLSLKTCDNGPSFLGYGSDDSEQELVDTLADGSDTLNETFDTDNTDLINDGTDTSDDIGGNSSNSINTGTSNNGGAYDEIDYSNTERGQSVIQSIDYDGEQCVIIVGSFKKAKNVLKMKNKVENLGYSVFTEYYGDYTRVGLKFSCREDDLDVYIQEIKQKLDKAAWYLYSPGK